LTRILSFRRAEVFASADTRTLKRALYDASTPAFAVAFVVAFLAPVLPIPLRSELYVYLPVFGVCLFVGWLSVLLFRSIERRSLVAIAAYVAVLAAYQIARARDIHQDLLFSEELITAVRRNAQIAATQKAVLLIPSDAATERSLQNAIGGYLYLAFEHAFSSAPRAAAVQYRGDPPHQADLRLMCAYRQNDRSVVISPAP